jgi:hypothetical protein
MASVRSGASCTARAQKTDAFMRTDCSGLRVFQSSCSIVSICALIGSTSKPRARIELTCEASVRSTI